jgi:uncharacterized protein YjcR
MSFYDGEGELNGMAILTNATVREIKALYLTGRCSLVDLASAFGVKKTTVFDVISTKHWDHLLEPGEAEALAQMREQRRDNYNFKHRRRQYG